MRLIAFLCSALLLLAVTGPAIGDAAPEQPGLPSQPLVVDLAAKGRVTGRSGGQLRILLPREKDIRLMTVWGYARVVGYNEKLELVPDIAQSFENDGNKVFTFHLRPGHKWSDGAPFTSEDFRYFWEDIATNKELSPGGPPVELLAGDELPKVEILDAATVRYSWSTPNPGFLHALAQSREPFIYRPAHYLRRFHQKYGDAAEIAKLVKEKQASGWARLHNQLDSPYDADNPEMPSLQPWIVKTNSPSQRYVFVRNPYFHRVDSNGVQLPYIHEVVLGIAEGGLITAKTAAGESDLQVRGLNFNDITSLKGAEGRSNFKTLLWPVAKASQLALYPNLNANDQGWRKLMRDVRFRKALSLAINRNGINKSLFFGLATEGNNTVLPLSPLYSEERVTRNAVYDTTEANRLLDEMGLVNRNGRGIRLMEDGRPVEIVVETAGESAEETDILTLIGQSWDPAIGVKLVIKASDRDIQRNRAYSGEAVMTASWGWDNGIPTPDMSPEELAPVRQETMCWPKWGQFYWTHGQSGEAVDMPEAQELMTLYTEWRNSASTEDRTRIWTRMLEIHADQVFVIGTVSGVTQPIAVSNALRNVPEKGVFSWDPGAQFGMYRMDEFWLDR
jgi:peptide/nickel transport system substrate-binding protein